MTLVLTEVSTLGVAMAADSAVTVRPSGRVYIGAQKLLPVYEIDAGLSIWGEGVIGDKPADEWLQDFITSDVVSGVGLWDMANRLAEKVNQVFGSVIPRRMGIHVGGFDEKDGIRVPAFYHIHNGHYHPEVRNRQIVEIPDEDPPIREFRAHPDHPPGREYRMTRNGDFAIFAFLYGQMNPLFDRIREATGLVFPYPPSLEARGEYLRFWIKTLVEIYRLSNYRRRILPQPATAGDASIGGPVTVLTISESGIKSFYTR